MYKHTEIEDKYIRKWREEGVYKTNEDKTLEKKYVLSMFPYPSGDGLHIGHCRIYASADIYARYKTMSGFNVLQPMGYDAFGLPAEEFAIKNKLNPKTSTKKNIKTFHNQLTSLGIAYDWDKELSTTDEEYYIWTQWIFLKMYKKGLVYYGHEPINWCPKCKTGLANEDLEGIFCERCETKIQRKLLRQVVLKITKYAEKLLDGLDTLPWNENVKEIQRNWIGKKKGYKINFSLLEKRKKWFLKTEEKTLKEQLEVFSTRPETIFGIACIVVAPESKILSSLLEHLSNQNQVKRYRDKIFLKGKNLQDTTKTGIKLKGVHAVHPLTKKEVPIYISDYVLGTYGTGAIFVVPAHDQRDYDFCKKFGLDITEVIDGGKLPYLEINEDDKMVNSKQYTGLKLDEAKRKIIKDLGIKETVVYKLQDWVFSRQRYWGEPIPLIHCEKCGVVPVPERDLPVRLPDIDKYEPTGTGESPLANIDDFVNVNCPSCNSLAKRETNTMPQWAGSCWYYLRFIDNKNDKEFINSDLEKYWMNVDSYFGGIEHVARHLIYSRFWHKFLYDENLVSTEEPFNDLNLVGILKASDGSKMSKRKGNTVNPTELVETFGADAVRLYIAFIAPFEKSVAWNTNGVVGTRKFLERVFNMFERIKEVESEPMLKHLQNETIKKVAGDIDGLKFNTALSTLMVFSNRLQKQKEISKESYVILIKLLAPFAPFITEDLWSKLGETGSIHKTKYPRMDVNQTFTVSTKIIVQLNGKLKGVLEAEQNLSEEEVVEMIQKDEKLFNKLNQKTKPKVFIPNKLINFTD